MMEYRGRATLATAGLLDGRATLLIRGVRVSDQGEYRCLFKDNDDFEEATVHLKVAGGYRGDVLLRHSARRLLLWGTMVFILQITLNLKMRGRRRVGY